MVRFLVRKVKSIRARIIDRGVRDFVRGNLLLKSRFRPHKPIEIHFFTLVLNGMPFIKYHIETFRKLNHPWKWHIVEGVADLKHDTAWSLQCGGKIMNGLHKNGLSNDGLTGYIDKLAKQYPNNIHIYRKPKGKFWNGKVEMCNAVLKNIRKECLLWQIDVDEFWNSNRIETMIKMFEEYPRKTAAWFYCRFFVGPRLIITSRDTYSSSTSYEWLRVWRYKPGMFWTAHEPPTLVHRSLFRTYNVGKSNPFKHNDTEIHGLVFNHYAYVLPKQLQFKEIYYGYRDALKQWERLQNCNSFPVYLRDFFPWVKDNTIVEVSNNIFDASILEGSENLI